MITTTHSEYVDAFNSYVISSGNKVDMDVKIQFTITSALMELGNNSSDKVSFLRDQIYIDIKKRYKTLRIDEFKLLVSKGVRGDYGVVVTLSIAILNNWIKYYMNDVVRTNAISVYNSKNTSNQIEFNPSRTYSESEKETIVREGVVSIYKDFCNDETIYISLSHFYPNLREWIVKNITEEMKAEIFANAKATFKFNPSNKLSEAVADLEGRTFNNHYKHLLVKKAFTLHKLRGLQILNNFK